LKTHLSDTQNYLEFCKIVTENKGIVHFTPQNLAATQKIKRFSILKESYNLAKLFLKKHIYSNPEFCTDFERLEQVEDIWEDFETTLMQCEFNFYFQDREAKESFQKVLTDNAETLGMHNQNPEELLSVGRKLRELLGVGELLSSMDEDYKPEIKFIAEKNVLVELRDMSFSCEFVNALAWEQRISVKESKEWIKEFKKFLFLVYTTGGKSKLNPSEIVNRVWRLYIQCSHGYRKDIRTIVQACYRSENLEIDKQKEFYNQTLKAYEDNFGKPNTEIWPPFQQKSEDTGRFASYYLVFAKNCLTKKQSDKVLRKYQKYQKLEPEYDNQEQPEHSPVINSGPLASIPMLFVDPFEIKIDLFESKDSDSARVFLDDIKKGQENNTSDRNRTFIRSTENDFIGGSWS
jgi:hypothetical protein